MLTGAKQSRGDRKSFNFNLFFIQDNLQQKMYLAINFIIVSKRPKVSYLVVQILEGVAFDIQN